MNYRLTIPPNTVEGTPIYASYDIGRGVIREMVVSIPDGHKDLARLNVKTRGKILVPEFGSGEIWIRGNNARLVISPVTPIVLDGPPYEITLWGWNEDDTYEHTFTVEVS